MNAYCTSSPATILPGRLFSLAEALLGAPAQTDNKPWAPPVNVAEDDAAYQIAAELPGVAPADVRVVVRDGALSLHGERSSDSPEGRKLHLVEHRSGAFRRSFALPKDADGGNVSAAFKNGVLTVTVPKLTEAKPREIEVKVD
jgi:HSP20 family protein